jgi:hypothetical protein
MKVKFSNTFIQIIFLFLISGCSNYTIPLSGFKDQFSGVDSTKLRLVEIKGVAGYEYLANPINTIEFDKKGNVKQLLNGPSIEVRFTYGKSNKRQIFYFDRTMIWNNTVIGAQSRFIPSISK